MDGRTRWTAWALLTAAGVLLLALPDTGPRILSLSEEHGPSLVDGIGVVLVLGGWLFLLSMIWEGRRRLLSRPLLFAAGGLSMLAGAALLVWSIGGDRGAWWVVAVALLAVPQLSAAGVASSRE